MSCKGICIRHKARKPGRSKSNDGKESRYGTGQKRCQVCEIFINWDDLWCPCCGYRLRTRPRTWKLKAKLRAIAVLESRRLVRIKLADDRGRPDQIGDV